MPGFYMILAREILTKLSNFTRFLSENARILHNNCSKQFFSDFFFGGGGHVPSLPPPSLVSYAYGFRVKKVTVRQLAAMLLTWELKHRSALPSQNNWQLIGTS